MSLRSVPGLAIIDPWVGYTDWGDPEGWSVYVLETTDRVALIKKLRTFYGYEVSLGQIRDMVDKLPLMVPVLENPSASYDYLETFEETRAEAIAEEYRAIGCYVIIVPTHRDFQDFFEEQTDEVKEKIVYHINAFN